MATTSATKNAPAPAAISGVHCIEPSTPALASVSLPASLCIINNVRAGGRGLGIENAPVSNAQLPQNPLPFSPPVRAVKKKERQQEQGLDRLQNEATISASRLDPTVDRNHAATFDHGQDSGDSTCIFALSTHFIFWSFSRA